MKRLQKEYRRLVIKIGSSLFYSAENKLDFVYLKEIISQISDLIKQDNKEIVLVSSGAIGLGMAILKLESRPKELAFLQAAAAFGQHELMDVFRRYFSEKGLNCAQLLLTWEDFSDRKRYLNAKHTLSAILEYKGVPIINENDTVSTEEIKFGDNDKLSALVATLIGADLLIILSDVDGLMQKDKKTLVKTVDKISAQIKELACSTNRKTSVGGMVTKIEAAKVAVDSGIPCIIANGRKKDIIQSCIKNPFSEGTLFIPKEKCLEAKKRWIAFSARPKGEITVDEGARLALSHNKSLLSVGIISQTGDFCVGDIVSIKDKHNLEFARGRIRLASTDLNKIIGKRWDKEIIHRDEIVLLE